MSDFVYNPRRAPRALIGGDAKIVRDGGSLEGAVIDFGPTGCLLVTATPLQSQEAVGLVVRSGALPEPVTLRGRIIWTSPDAPFRAGVRFDSDGHDAAALAYGRLAAANPDFIEVGDLPERLAMSSRLVPQEREEDAAVLPGETEVLLAIGRGITVRELRERLGDRWEGAVNPVFALLARRLIAVEGERA